MDLTLGNLSASVACTQHQLTLFTISLHFPGPSEGLGILCANTEQKDCPRTNLWLLINENLYHVLSVINSKQSNKICGAHCSPQFHTHTQRKKKQGKQMFEKWWAKKYWEETQGTSWEGWILCPRVRAQSQISCLKWGLICFNKYEYYCSPIFKGLREYLEYVGK